MPDDRQRLRETVEKLQAQLKEAQSLDPKVAACLRETIADIQASLAGERRKPSGGRSLADRLSEVALDFEASHPTLAGTVGSIIDALARMGI